MKSVSCVLFPCAWTTLPHCTHCFSLQWGKQFDGAKCGRRHPICVWHLRCFLHTFCGLFEHPFPSCEENCYKVWFCVNVLFWSTFNNQILRCPSIAGSGSVPSCKQLQDLWCHLVAIKTTCKWGKSDDVFSFCVEIFYFVGKCCVDDLYFIASSSWYYTLQDITSANKVRNL